MSTTSQQMRITSQQGLVIVLPDILVSPTKIADACSCMRRAVISTRLRGLNCKSNSSAALGNLKHQFIEVSQPLSLSPPPSLSLTHSVCLPQMMLERYLGKLTLPQENSTEISKLILDTISDHLEALVTTNVSDDLAYEELHSIVPAVNSWIQKCSSQLSLPVDAPPALLRRSSSSTETKIETIWNELVSTEEVVWSPALGIRGQIDIIVSGKIIEPGDSSFGNELLPSIIPVELKTGKWRLESLVGHRAQIILYLVMLIVRENLSWRQRQSCCQGILLYLGSKDAETKWEIIAPTWGEIRALVQVRNKLASYLKNNITEVSPFRFSPVG
jgi:DNA replication ATP-dependent helicase Dna2